MDELIGEGRTFEAILLTHHHIDHVGAVNAVSRRYRLPVRAHKETYRRVDGDYITGEPLADGDRLELGTAPDGSSDWHLKVVHTPGHAVDHLCYIDSRYHAAIAGDMLSTISTIIIDPPEGHMRTYLNSLNRLLEIPVKTLYPAHGLPHQDGHSLIRRFLKHRQKREDAIKSALAGDPRSIDELLPDAYADVSADVYPVASRSLLAGLIKLEEDGFLQATRRRLATGLTLQPVLQQLFFDLHDRVDIGEIRDVSHDLGRVGVQRLFKCLHIVELEAGDGDVRRIGAAGAAQTPVDFHTAHYAAPSFPDQGHVGVQVIVVIETAAVLLGYITLTLIILFLLRCYMLFATR